MTPATTHSPPYNVFFWATTNQQTRIRKTHPFIKLQQNQQGMTIALTNSTHAQALLLAKHLKHHHQISSWIVPSAYQDKSIPQHEAEALALAEFAAQQLSEKTLVFSKARPTLSLGNPMTWAFVVDVHKQSKPRDTWRRYVEIDRVTGAQWKPDTYAEYRKFSPLSP